MQKHKSFLIIFVVSISGMHYMSGWVSNQENLYENRKINSMVPAEIGTCFVGIFLLIGSLSAVSLTDYLNKYIKESQSSKDDILITKEVGYFV